VEDDDDDEELEPVPPVHALRGARKRQAKREVRQKVRIMGSPRVVSKRAHPLEPGCHKSM
jgi:hypothetical protein